MMRQFKSRLISLVPRRSVPTLPLTLALSGLIGMTAGVGATLFTLLIEFVSTHTVERFVNAANGQSVYWLAVIVCPALGMLFAVIWTRRFAAEAQGHGIPEVITAVARHDGMIRIRVSVVKIIASAMTIGMGGSVGREGPIVQIGSSMGSAAGQVFGLSAPSVKVLVAAGAAAAISATFNAPIAGVIFASEIILGSFAVESMTPIVIASVLANVVQKHIGEYGLDAAFPHVYYRYVGAWSQLPTYLLLGICCGIAAAAFVKMLYWCEDLTTKWLPDFKSRAIVLGLLVGCCGVLYPMYPPSTFSVPAGNAEHQHSVPPLFGGGLSVVEHTLHFDRVELIDDDADRMEEMARSGGNVVDRTIYLSRDEMLGQVIWLLPLVFLKPLLTSLTLAGGGSGGVFAPSLFLGATLGACFGLICNLVVPGMSASPGVYAIVGMGAAVAGTTQAVLSAILIVYELTNDYHIILPIMTAAGIASVLARTIDPESIYQKKLSRRGDVLARGQDLHRVEHVMVRDVMVSEFPTVRYRDNLAQIIAVARANSHIESLPVMDDDGALVGIIRSEDLHRVLDTDVPVHMLTADDIALTTPMAVSPNDNLLEALRDFGRRDIETLPVEEVQGGEKRLVGLLLRNEVMQRYRQEILG